MNMLTSAVFWGIIIVLFGLSLILKAMFNITFPFFRIIFGLVIIYFGVKVISGGWSGSSSEGRSAWWGKSSLSYVENEDTYSIVFGQGTIDLTGIKKYGTNQVVEAQIIFGDGKVLIPEDYPLKVEMSSAFGKVSLNDKSVSGIGSTMWHSPSYKKGESYTKVKVDAVFGQAIIVEK